ncbi:MAG: response regulator [Rhodoferax sp.]|nr:response regulator [Rhodoferax sp.]MCF8209262.1 response regulator [Rhodoferax sp.]
MNLLIADASERIRSRLAERLGSVPGVVTVATAATLRQAYAYVRSGSFGLAIMDLHLPDGTASTLAHAMKQASRGLVVVVFSNDADAVNRRLCQKAGVDWFFDKSLEFDEVLRLTSTLAHSHASAASPLPADAGCAPSPWIPGVR